MKIEDHKLLPCPFCGGEAKMLQAAFENEEIAAKYVSRKCLTPNDHESKVQKTPGRGELQEEGG